MTKKHKVLVVLEAKPGLEKDLERALVAVIEPSRAEETCLDYRLHRSIDNPGIFFLYETWESKEKHALQFEKPYIKVLGEQLETLLSKPYQVIFAKEI